MRTAFRRDNVIDEAVGALRKGIVVLESNLHIYIILLALTVDHAVVQSGFALIQISDKLLDTTLVMENLLFLLFPFISQDDLQVFCQESCLAQTLL